MIEPSLVVVVDDKVIGAYRHKRSIGLGEARIPKIDGQGSSILRAGDSVGIASNVSDRCAEESGSGASGGAFGERCTVLFVRCCCSARIPLTECYTTGSTSRAVHAMEAGFGVNSV